MKIRYVSKFPPSSSGIALYASRFERVLNTRAFVQREAAPGEPRESQRLRSALRGARLALSGDDSDLVHVELSGRALFEFYFAATHLLRHPRSPLAVTVHDPPSIAGASLLFTCLDRRGLRRIGMEMSTTLGRTLESFVMNRATAVFCLTAQGAESLRRQGIPATHIPHVVDTPAPQEKERRVFVPGPVGSPDVAQLSRVVQLVGSRSEKWTLVVGWCRPEVQTSLDRAARGAGTDLSFTGYLPEDELLQQFARAAVVVRPVAAGPADNLHAASGPLSWAAANGCVTITDDRRSGAMELERLGLLTRSDDLAQTLGQVMDSYDPSVATQVQRRAGRALGIDRVAQSYFTAISPAKGG